MTAWLSVLSRIQNGLRHTVDICYITKARPNRLAVSDTFGVLIIGMLSG